MLLNAYVSIEEITTTIINILYITPLFKKLPRERVTK